MRDEGTGKPVAESVDDGATHFAVWSVLPLILVTAVATSAVSVVTAVILMAIVHCLFRFWVVGKLGGYTGDTLGAMQQLSEVALLLGMLMWR